MKALTTGPIACEASDAETPEGLKRALGRIAFESPALLGGAAGRMGLSCSSCHINGRGNPDFFVEGVSGAPGTADVTSSLFSKVRGDGHVNPIAIPDLAVRNGGQIKDRASAEFREKVHGLIVEEFDGQEPPEFVFDAVLAYLAGLDVAHCDDPSAVEPMDAVSDYAPVFLAIVLIGKKDASKDVKLFYIRVARERLERLHERFAGERDVAADLLALSDSFADAGEAIRDDRTFRPFEDKVLTLAVSLVRNEPRSFYNPDVLRVALQPPE